MSSITLRESLTTQTQSPPADLPTFHRPRRRSVQRHRLQAPGLPAFYSVRNIRNFICGLNHLPASDTVATEKSVCEELACFAFAGTSPGRTAPTTAKITTSNWSRP